MESSAHITYVKLNDPRFEGSKEKSTKPGITSPNLHA